MRSRRYCPSCGSFSIQRVHRSFLQKYVLRISESYQCDICDFGFTENHIYINELRKR